ncbi:MAG: hypothetical protein ABFD91_01785 [Anaerohalosphaeraceae bacterium]
MPATMPNGFINFAVMVEEISSWVVYERDTVVTMNGGTGLK